MENEGSHPHNPHPPSMNALGKTRPIERLLVWGCLVACGFLIGLTAAVEPAVALFVVLGLLTLPWTIRNIHLVVLLIAIYTPFEEFILKWMPTSLASALRFAPEALILLLLMCLLLQNMGRGIPWKKTPIDLPVVLFLLLSAFSAAAGDVPIPVWILGIREFARYIILYYLIVNAELTDRFAKLLTVALLVAATAEASIGLLQAVLGNRFSLFLAPQEVTVGSVVVRQGFTQILSGGTRIFGTLGRYNRFGFFLALFCLLGLGLYLALRSRLGSRKTLAFVAFASLMGAAMVLSFSRTSWLALYVGGLVALLASGRKRILFLALVIPLLAAVLMLSSVALEDWSVARTEEASVAERFTATFSPEYMSVLLTRGRLFILAKVSPIVLRDYTWLGLGPGTIGSMATGGGTSSPGLFPDYSHEDWLDVTDVGRTASLRFLHDVGWVAILAQVGVLGLAAYLWIIAQLVRTAFYSFRRSDDLFVQGLSLGFLACVAAIMVGNFSSFVLSLRAVSMYLWLFGGIVTTYWIRLRAGDTYSVASPLRGDHEGLDSSSRLTVVGS